MIHASAFNATGDGIADDTAALQAAFNHVALFGGALVLGRRHRLTAPLAISSAAAPFVIEGEGEALSALVRGADFPEPILSTTLVNDFTLRRFTVDVDTANCPLAGHGIAIDGGFGIEVSDVTVKGHRNSAVLFMANAGPGGKSRMHRVTADGLGVANNGILISNHDQSGIDDCRVYGCPGSPGYGLQLKNQSTRCYIRDSYAEGCTSGIAFGQDISAPAVRHSMVANVKTYNCGRGFVAGYAEENFLTALDIDMNGQTNNAVDLNMACKKNVMVGMTVRNLAATRSAIRIRSGGDDNYADFAALTAVASGGALGATFDPGVLRNRVRLGAVLSPVLTPPVMIHNDASGNTTNRFELW
jgi:hypothetical protein